MTQHICGIAIFNSTSNNLNNNTVKDNWIGIYLYQSNSTNITWNIITGNGGGISTYDSNSTTMSGNSLTDNWLADTSTVNSANMVMATTIYTCGPAALATVMKHLGVNATEMELAQWAGTDETGTSMWGLAQAANRTGLTAKGFIINDTSQLKTDYIVVLNINGVYHYNIIRNITNTTVYLTDPNLGDIEMSLDKFKELFTGYVLVVANGTIQINATNMTEQQMKNIKAMSHYDIYCYCIYYCHDGYSYNFRDLD
ncbi:MAG: parallel beta-helix repeat (two copies) [Methanobacterium sp. Maddingley MBC34]|nr:MAG: parallel beta-helix repeat (two copies) [Methanobacterium sp. Maddingley MBC34]